MIKRLLVVVAIALLLGVSSTAKAQTASDLQKMIADLQAKIAALSGGSAATSGHVFNTNLTVNSTGADVIALQDWLSAKGFLSIPAGTQKGFFGQLTKNAVIAYQTSVALPATGFVGPQTRAMLNAAAPVSGNNGSTNNGGSVSLSGDEGTLDINDELGDVENEVDEGTSENVFGIEVESSDSDISIERVDVLFTLSGTGSTRLDRYVETVNLMLEGKKIASMDVSDAKRDGDKTTFRFTGLDGVVKKDQTAELYVEVEAINNVDGSDVAKNIAVTIEEVRYTDGAGLSDTVDQVDTETFNVVAADGGDLDISEATSNPDEGPVSVDVDNTTDGVTLLAFDLEANDSDVTIFDLAAGLYTTGTNLSDAVRSVKLMQGSKVLKTENVPATGAYTEIVFDNIDLDINKDDTETLKIVVDLKAQDGNYSNGIALSASTTEDLAGWDTEDAVGDTATLSGVAQGDAQTLRSVGVVITKVGDTSSEQLYTGDDVTTNDQGKFTLTFEVSAFEEPAYIALSTGSTTVENNTGVNYLIENTSNTTMSTGTSSATTLSHVSGGSRSGNYVRINKGETAKFTLTAYYDAATTGTYRAQLYSVNFNDTEANADTQQLVTPEYMFETKEAQVLN